MRDKILQSNLNVCFFKFKKNIALECGRQMMTYAELDEKSNYVANWILEKGIKKEAFIGILSEDRVKLIVTLIGILKAGCVFVPLDSAYPLNRIRVMIETTDLQHVFIDKANLGRFDKYDMSTFKQPEFTLIDHLFRGQKKFRSKTKSDVPFNPEDRIYIYFTSGTTGLPKAIVGKNKGLRHFINWEIDTLSINETFRCSQFTNPGFDAFLRDIFVPLCSGGTICVPESKDVILNSEELTKWIEKSGINLIHCVPSLFRSLASKTFPETNFNDLKFILLSGERIKPVDLENWYRSFNGRVQLVNLWGTSETTLAKTFYFIQKEDIHRENIPVGKPIKGARVIILDKNMDVCDEHITGELYIRTPFRTSGYYNDPDLNREKFIKNPFNDDPDDLLHKTGDLGRYLPDGNIEVLGRVDRQIKILGYRVELEEIENVLMKYPPVKEAVVLKKEISGNDFLCAYITEKEKDLVEEDIFVSNLNEYLLENLPTYMVPSKIIKMEGIPRTLNGKVDFNILPDPLLDKRDLCLIPSNEAERKLVTIWSEILGLEEIDLKSHFYALGGNSLKIMSLITRIHKEFDVRIPLGEIIANPTIIDQARIILESDKEKFRSINSVEKKEYYPLSSAQRRLYILNKLHPEDLSYNIPMFLELEGDVNKQILDRAFVNLISRHESFRTMFLEKNGEPFQKIEDELSFSIAISLSDSEGVNYILNNFVRPFDLSLAPLIRVESVEINDKRNLLMLDMHHIITDGTSFGIAINELIELYKGEELPASRIQYKDYSEWQNSAEVKEAKREWGKYWLKEFEDGGVPLNLPTDYERPLSRSFEGHSINFQIGKEETSRLETLALTEDTTVYIVMLAIANIFLSKICAQEDLVVGTGILGRMHSDLKNMVGLFINALPLRNFPAKWKVFIDFLREVKERTSKAFENQEYQFEDLVRQVCVKREAGRNPLFDVVFEMQNIKVEKAAIPGLKINRFRRENQQGMSKFDLTIVGSQENDQLFFTFEYCTKLFKKETIEKFIKYFQEIVKCVVENESVLLQDIKISHGLYDHKLENPQISFNFKLFDSLSNKED